MITIAGRFAAHGYKIESTGGNCTAYVRRGSGESRVMVTEAGCMTAPEFLDDDIEIGVYDADGDGAVSLIGTTLGAYLTLLDAHT